MKIETLQRRFKLLTANNPKTEKGSRQGYLTAILHLAPADLSGFNVCQYAGACKAPCLNTAGRGGMFRLGESSNVIQRCRIRRTRLFFENRAEFFRLLTHDLVTLRAFAQEHDMRPACRLNGTSDIPWERIKYHGSRNVMEAWPSIQFYDYTKIPISKRGVRPSNYYLTFSLDAGAENAAHALEALALGVNVAVPFSTKKGKPLPSGFHFDTNGTWHVPVTWPAGRVIANRNAITAPVIDADLDDLRFLDPTSCIVGLRAKGRAKRDTSGFVKVLS